MPGAASWGRWWCNAAAVQLRGRELRRIIRACRLLHAYSICLALLPPHSWLAAPLLPCSPAQGHRGRGIWQCALHGRLLLTGGADSSVKCWYLPDWLPPGALAALEGGSGREPDGPAAASSSGAGGSRDGGGCGSLPDCLALSYELLLGLPRPDGCAVGAVASVQHEAGRLALPLQLQQEGQGQAAGGGGAEARKRGLAVDSKAEWVRCLVLAGRRVLYVATNRGLIHRVWLPGEPGGRGGAGGPHLLGAN